VVGSNNFKLGIVQRELAALLGNLRALCSVVTSLLRSQNAASMCCSEGGRLPTPVVSSSLICGTILIQAIPLGLLNAYCMFESMSGHLVGLCCITIQSRSIQAHT